MENENQRALPRIGYEFAHNHTAAATRIFRWNSVRKFIADVDSTYATRVEVNRDVLLGGMYSASSIADVRISPLNNDQGMSPPPKSIPGSSTAYRLVSDYKWHINLKYPVLFDSELDPMVEEFLQLQRKRTAMRGRVSEAPYRSVEHAMVLVIFALGRICKHREDENALQQASPGPSSAEEDVSQASQAATPGLTFFHEATDIMAKHFGSNNLAYVRLNILACLYLGQLGRVSQGQVYLHEATRALKVMVER